MPNAKPRASPAPPARAEVAEPRWPAAKEPLSPTTKVLIAGGAVVAGVAVLSVIQAKGGIGKIFGAPTTTTTAAQRAALAAQAAAKAGLAVPTQAGITFRSGSLGGFIPIPFDKIVSGLFSSFQPSKSEAVELTAPAVSILSPTPLQAEIQQAVLAGAIIGGGAGPEQPVETWSGILGGGTGPEQPVQIEASGSFFTPVDQWEAGKEFYGRGEMEIGSEYTEYSF